MEIHPEKVVLVGFCELNTARHVARTVFGDNDSLDLHLSAMICDADWPDGSSKVEVPMPEGMHIVYALHRYKNSMPSDDWFMAQAEKMLPTLPNQIEVQ